MYTDQSLSPAVSVAHRKSSRSLVCPDDVHGGLQRIGHQKCTSLVWMRSWKELQTKLQQHRSRTTRRIVLLMRASSRRSLLAVEEWCLRGCTEYLRERASARGSSCSARGILIRVQDVAEVAMTVAADTIHTAFFGASFSDQLPNHGLSIYSIHSYRSIECTGH